MTYEYCYNRYAKDILGNKKVRDIKYSDMVLFCAPSYRRYWNSFIDKALEVDFDYGNAPVHFIDMESDTRLKLFPNEVAETYRATMHRMMDDIKRHAVQYKIDYIPVDVELGFEQVMLPYLIKRSRHF